MEGSNVTYRWLFKKISHSPQEQQSKVLVASGRSSAMLGDKATLLLMSNKQDHILIELITLAGLEAGLFRPV